MILERYIKLRLIYDWASLFVVLFFYNRDSEITNTHLSGL